MKYLQAAAVVAPRSYGVHPPPDQYPDLALHIHSHRTPSADSASYCPLA